MDSKLRFIVRDIPSELDLIVLLGRLTLDDPEARAELAAKVDAIFDEFNPVFDENGSPCECTAIAAQPGQVVYDIAAKSNDPCVAHRLMNHLRSDGESVDAIYFPAEMPSGE